jgi:hypothetical protein
MRKKHGPKKGKPFAPDLPFLGLHHRMVIFSFLLIGILSLPPAFSRLRSQQSEK